MTQIHAQALDTPDGPFTVIELPDGTVVASGWSAEIGKIAAQSPLSRNAETVTVHAEGPDLASARAVRDYYGGDVRAIETLRVANQGTPLQQAVWERLREIHCGYTLSYGELARSIDAPAASRAVASACARNAIGLFVPCHRVVSATGALSGFAWGLPVKASLLEREQLRVEHPNS